jgi:glutathione synthase
MSDHCLRLGFLIDPFSSLHPEKDSTLAMIRAAHARGWIVTVFEAADVWLDNGRLQARVTALTRSDSTDAYEVGTPEVINPVDKLDVVLMRKDPPFDGEFLNTLYWLDRLHQSGVMVTNSPLSLMRYNEKLAATLFPQCCPPYLVSRAEDQLQDFIRHYQDVILKPLDGMGGQSIFRVTAGDANARVIIETLTKNGCQTIMAQRFIPEISQGDKRVLIIHGEVVPFALARIPPAGEIRGNLAVGGRGVAQPLSVRDEWICAELKPWLQSEGILLAGIDIIGDYLTEINITSPTGIRQLDRSCDLDIGGLLMDSMVGRWESYNH